MASIHIQRNHTLGMEGARRAVENVAAQMRQKLDLAYTWNGNMLEFQRTGATGRIEVEEKSVTVDVELNFMLGAFKGSIEQEIKGFLDRDLR